MKLLKKNQVIIYVIVLMLMTAGYLNYTSNPNNDTNTIETSMKMESTDDMQLADIGDATLVNSNDIVSENEMTSNTTSNTTTDSEMNNTEEKNTTIGSTNELNNNTTVSNNENTDINTNTNLSDEEISRDTQQTNSTVSDDYFVKSKLERDTMYSQMIESYEKILNSSNALETQKQVATQEISEINNIKNSIMICENLIKTKGFQNNIIFVNGDSISIIIGTQEIQQEEVAQIQNIISREMKAEIENIHISTK